MVFFFSGHSIYTFDREHRNVVTNTRFIEACPAFAHIQPTISIVKERRRCCKENRSEDISTTGYIAITVGVDDHRVNRTLSELIEEKLNETTDGEDGYSCTEPNCLRLLPRFEISERLVNSIQALPIYLRHANRRSGTIRFGNEEIRILSQQDGVITFTLLGCLQFTGTIYLVRIDTSDLI